MHIVASAPAQLVVRTQSDRIAFFHVETGASLGHRVQASAPLHEEYLSDEWLGYFSTLRDFEGTTYLPLMRTNTLQIYNSADGRTRLIRSADNRIQILRRGTLKVLDIPSPPLAIAMQSSSGQIAILDAKSRLQLIRQGERVFFLDIGLPLDSISANLVAFADAADVIFASNGREIVRVGSGGKVEGRTDVHYGLAQMACAPEGDLLATSDNHSGLIRVYSGSDLRLSHQRHAQDLIAEARQLQLLSEMPPTSVATSALALGKDGALCFAMSGVICKTNIGQMSKIP